MVPNVGSTIYQFLMSMSGSLEHRTVVFLRTLYNRGSLSGVLLPLFIATSYLTQRILYYYNLVWLIAQIEDPIPQSHLFEVTEPIGLYLRDKKPINLGSLSLGPS